MFITTVAQIMLTSLAPFAQYEGGARDFNNIRVTMVICSYESNLCQRINLRSIRDLCHFEIEFQTEKEQ